MCPCPGKEFEEFRRDLLGSSPTSILKSRLFFREPYVFRGLPGTFDKFREELSGALGVPQRSIAIVGSAQLGFSVAPGKVGSECRPDSDIDVVVVSARHFDSVWLDLIDMASETWRESGFDRKRMSECMSDLYWGFIRLDQVPRKLALAQQWIPVFDRLSVDSRFGRRPISARLYRTWEQAEKSYSHLPEDESIPT